VGRELPAGRLTLKCKKSRSGASKELPSTAGTGSVSELSLVRESGPFRASPPASWMPGKRDSTPGCRKEGGFQEIRSRLCSAAEAAEKKGTPRGVPFNIHHWGDYTLLGPCGLLAGVGHHLEERKVISYACQNSPAFEANSQWHAPSPPGLWPRYTTLSAPSHM